MASGTQNLSSKIYIKTQNKQITGNGVAGIIPPATCQTVYKKDMKEEYYIKRIIGLPGETVQIDGEDILFC